MVKTEIASARVEPWIKTLIKNRGMTIREALEYVALILASPVEITKAEIRRIENEIKQLQLEHENAMNKLDEIQALILIKEEIIDDLMGRIENEDEFNPIYEQVKPAIEAINNAAKRFNCSPLHVNKYAARDLISFQAQKCGVPKKVLTEFLIKENK